MFKKCELIQAYPPSHSHVLCAPSHFGCSYSVSAYNFLQMNVNVFFFLPCSLLYVCFTMLVCLQIKQRKSTLLFHFSYICNFNSICGVHHRLPFEIRAHLAQVSLLLPWQYLSVRTLDKSQYSGGLGP